MAFVFAHKGQGFGRAFRTFVLSSAFMCPEWPMAYMYPAIPLSDVKFPAQAAKPTETAAASNVVKAEETKPEVAVVKKPDAPAAVAAPVPKSSGRHEALI